MQVRDPAKIAWLSQTTLSVDETVATVDRLRERFPLLVDPPSDDICYATQNRQVAVKKIAAGSDLMLVVGSRNSSNSVRLVEVALEAGSRAAYLVDRAADIDEAWLAGVETVGVTSGASVPEILVRGVIEWLAERGWTDVEEVTSAQESLLFALPPELRRDLGRRGPLIDLNASAMPPLPARTLVAPTHRCERNGEQGAREQQRRWSSPACWRGRALRVRRCFLSFLRAGTAGERAPIRQRPAAAGSPRRRGQEHATDRPARSRPR